MIEDPIVLTKDLEVLSIDHTVLIIVLEVQERGTEEVLDHTAQAGRVT